jgi:Coenzyme PQQ synthesis protein D (PqqD)
MPLTLDSLVVRTEGLMSTPLDREVVILNPARDNYVGLDEVGRRVWDLLATPNSVKDLCLQVTGEFDGDPRQIEEDVLAFLTELANEGLVDVAKVRFR